MTVTEFMTGLEYAFNVKFTPERASIYRQQLLWFKSDDLSALYNAILRSCKRFPTVADIYDCGAELGFKSNPKKETVSEWIHSLDKTDCRLCGGEGLLSVGFEILFDEQQVSEHGRKSYKRLRSISPFSSEQAIISAAQPGIYMYVFRCCCQDGDDKGIPKAWPRWKTEDAVRG